MGQSEGSVPLEPQPSMILDQLAQRAKRYKKAKIYELIAYLSFQFLFATSALEFALIIQSLQLAGYPYIFFLAAAGLIAVIVISFLNARKFRIKREHESAVIAYMAYDAVRTMPSIDIENDERKQTTRAVERLIFELQKWWNTKTPGFMSRPAIELVENLREKVLPIIQVGDREQIRSTEEPLLDLALILAGTPTGNNISCVTQKLKSLTILQVKAKWSSKCLKRQDILKPLAFFGAGLATSLIAFYILGIGKDTSFTTGVAVALTYGIYYFKNRSPSSSSSETMKPKPNSAHTENASSPELKKKENP